MIFFYCFGSATSNSTAAHSMRRPVVREGTSGGMHPSPNPNGPLFQKTYFKSRFIIIVKCPFHETIV